MTTEKSTTIETREIFNAKHGIMRETIKVSDIIRLEGFNHRSKISEEHVVNIKEGTYQSPSDHDGNRQRDAVALSPSYELLEGEHRYTAALRQQEETGKDVWVQFFIREADIDSLEVFEQHVKENLNDKKAWSALEWGAIFTRAKKEHGLTQAEIGKMFECTGAHVSNCIKAHRETCEEIHKLNADGIITLSQVQILLGKGGKNARKRVSFEDQRELVKQIRKIHNEAKKDEEEHTHAISQAKTEACEKASAKANPSQPAEESASRESEGESSAQVKETPQDDSPPVAGVYSLIPRPEFTEMIQADFSGLEGCKSKKMRASYLANLTGKATMLGYDGMPDDEDDLREFFSAFSGLESLTGEEPEPEEAPEEEEPQGDREPTPEELAESEALLASLQDLEADVEV